MNHLLLLTEPAFGFATPFGAGVVGFLPLSPGFFGSFHGFFPLEQFALQTAFGGFTFNEGPFGGFPALPLLLLLLVALLPLPRLLVTLLLLWGNDFLGKQLFLHHRPLPRTGRAPFFSAPAVSAFFRKGGLSGRTR